MSFTRVNRISKLDQPHPAGLRIEQVDQWHPQWAQILERVERDGDRAKLEIDSDGWLSVRQVLLGAFDGTKIVGHLCFTLVDSPAQGSSGVPAARLEILQGTDRVSDQLRRFAFLRARTLKVRQFLDSQSEPSRGN